MTLHILNGYNLTSLNSVNHKIKSSSAGCFNQEILQDLQHAKTSLSIRLCLVISIVSFNMKQYHFYSCPISYRLYYYSKNFQYVVCINILYTKF